jgi:hypothetical protein
MLSIGLNSGLPGYDQTFNGATIISGSTHHILLPDSLALQTDQFNAGLDAFSVTPSLTSFDGSTSTSAPQSFSIPGQAIPTAPACSQYTNPPGMGNDDIAMLANETFLFEQTGW